MNRQDYLNAAADYICKSREEQYGSPEDSFGTIAGLWSIYLGREILPKDVAIMMALLKIARIAGGRFKADSYVDAIGYMACAGEIAERLEKATEGLK